MMSMPKPPSGPPPSQAPSEHIVHIWLAQGLSDACLACETYRGRALMVHGVDDWTHGKPFQLSTEQGVIDDIE